MQGMRYKGIEDKIDGNKVALPAEQRATRIIMKYEIYI